jgi:hypothetical protein
MIILREFTDIERLKSVMKHTTALSVVFIGLTISINTLQATIVLSHTFDGGTGALDGTTVDVGTGSWVALNDATNVVNANGVFNSGQGSATLAFTPSQGTQYQLDARVINVSGNANWVGFGFANGQESGSAGANRFIETYGSSGSSGVVGTAWMIYRGDNDPNSNRTFLGTGVKQVLGAGTSNGEDWSSLNNNGGSIDLRILLNTSGGTGNWTATWLAKETTSGTYTTLRSGVAVPQANEANYTSVGFAFSDAASTSGQLDSFSLTQIPEPSSFALIMLGLGGLYLLRRRNR